MVIIKPECALKELGAAGVCLRSVLDGWTPVPPNRTPVNTPVAHIEACVFKSRLYLGEGEVGLSAHACFLFSSHCARQCKILSRFLPKRGRSKGKDFT